MDASYIQTAAVILSALAAVKCCSGVHGNKKCSDLCAKLQACISFKFKPLRCECKLETTTKQGGIVGAIEMSSALNPSSKNFFQFLTMVKIVQDKEEPGIQKKEIIQDRRRHVLIVPDNRKRKVISLDLHKLTKVECKMKIDFGIIAMAYISSIERLIISKKVHSKVILSYDLKKRSSKIIVKDFAPKYFAVDEEKKLIFFIHGKWVKSLHLVFCLYKLTIGFEPPSEIKSFQDIHAQDILVNPPQQTLFCECGQFILEINYNGDTKRKIRASFATRGMCFDSEMQTLYYISRTYIKAVNLKSINITENIINIHKNSKGLTCYDNTLFVMSKSNRVFTVNLNSRVIVHWVDLKLKTKQKLPMCLLP